MQTLRKLTRVENCHFLCNNSCITTYEDVTILDAVSVYLNDILAPRLRKYGISESFLFYTINTIQIQICSLLRHWDDRAFRNTILLLGLEEGSFYEPANKIDIRCFVVVAIRNSPIETIQSDACREAALSAPLPNSAVKEITAEAIRYFSKQDFSVLCKQSKNSFMRDIYREIMRDHPVSWAALSKLAATSTKSVDYARITCDTPFILESITPQSGGNFESSKISKVLFDGFDPTIDPSLAELLGHLISSENNVLIVDSFKALTRNVEKLFHVLEFLLSRGHIFATSNFYLENGHVERRVNPLRAGHTTNEMFHNLSQISGLGHRHRIALNRYIKEISSPQ